MSPLSHILLTTVFFAFLVSSPTISSTQDDKWKEANDRGNRYEGLISISTGNPDVDFLSFIGFLEPFNHAVNLKVRFYLPASSDVAIIGQELEDQKQYWMEAKPNKWQGAKWNEFSPWPTDEVLLKESIPSSNLGVIVKYHDRVGRNYWIPAFAYHTIPPRIVTKYSLYLRVNRNLKKVSFYLYNDTNNRELDRRLKPVYDILANVPFRIELDMRGIPEGSIRLVIMRELRNSKESLPVREFRFYHKPVIGK